MTRQWVARAACRGFPMQWWFPDDGVDCAQARRVCAECAVQRECLDYALVEGEQWGVWGGTSQDERKRLRRVR